MVRKTGNFLLNLMKYLSHISGKVEVLKYFFFWKDSPFLKLSQDIRNFLTRPGALSENPFLPTKLGLADSKVVLEINNYHAEFQCTPGKTEAK